MYIYANSSIRVEESLSISLRSTIRTIGNVSYTQGFKLFLFLFAFIPHLAFAKEAEGSMDCIVTGNVVVSSEEGKFKTYAGIKGGVTTNEKLNLSYSVMGSSVYIALKREQADKNILVSAYLDSKNEKIFAERVRAGGLVIRDTEFNHSISFLPDFIRIYEFRQFKISRYYKNDWHGIYSYVEPFDLSTHTLTFNCRHIIDRMEEAFKIFNGYKPQK